MNQIYGHCHANYQQNQNPNRAWRWKQRIIRAAKDGNDAAWEQIKRPTVNITPWVKDLA